MKLSVWSVVVAAGTGSRFGGPKQLAPLGGRRVIDWSVAAAMVDSDGIVLVVPAEITSDLASKVGSEVTVVAGGATRSESVRAGLAAVPDVAEVVIVHDGARPVATPELFAAVTAAVTAGADAAIPVVPITDTIRLATGGVVDRSTLVAVQTPQAFAAAALRNAHASDDEATDDATLVELRGGNVVHVDGEPDNLKITNPGDLAMAESLISSRVRS